MILDSRGVESSKKHRRIWGCQLLTEQVPRAGGDLPITHCISLLATMDSFPTRVQLLAGKETQLCNFSLLHLVASIGIKYHRNDVKGSGQLDCCVECGASTAFSPLGPMSRRVGDADELITKGPKTPWTADVVSSPQRPTFQCPNLPKADIPGASLSTKGRLCL